MSVLDGPGEGTWSAFAMKVVEERDAARADVAKLKTLLREANGELRVLASYLGDDYPWPNAGLYVLAKAHARMVTRIEAALEQAGRGER